MCYCGPYDLERLYLIFLVFGIQLSMFGNVFLGLIVSYFLHIKKNIKNELVMPNYA